MYDYVLKQITKTSYRLYVPHRSHGFIIRVLLSLRLDYIKRVYCYMYYDYDIRIQVSERIDEDDRRQLDAILGALMQNRKGAIVPYMTKLTRFLPRDIGHVYRASWHYVQG